jgi:histidine triad (HIT) family protein
MSGQQCVFCDIAAGKAPAHSIMENELSMIFLDIYPLTRGHCLAIPKRHVTWWHEMTDKETESLFTLARAAADRLMKTFKPDFVGLYTRGRHVPHVHVHLVPTRGGDVLDSFFNALEKYQYAAEELAGLKSSESMDEIARLLK